MKQVRSFKTMVNSYPGTQRNNPDTDKQNRLAHGTESFNANQQFLVQKKKIPHFIEPDSSLPSSQQHATYP